MEDTGLALGGGYIETASGLMVPLEIPDPQSLRIEDIAHGLSNLCRFGGHCEKFYSVAEHSVLCYLHAKENYAMDREVLRAVLLHDASEAYLGDVTRPLKLLLGRAYTDLEKRWQAAIYDHFDCEPVEVSMKEIDNAVLKKESETLMNSMGRSWKFDGVEASPVDLRLWTPYYAKQWYLHVWKETYAKGRAT